jgi:hypothetical protein
MKLVKSYVDVLPVVVAGKVDEMLIVDAYCSRSELASAILSSAIQPRSSPTRDPDGVGAGIETSTDYGPTVCVVTTI